MLGSVTLVLAAFIACAASIYLTIYRPLVDDLISLEMRRASEKVADDVQVIFTRVEAIAARNRMWGLIGVIDLDDTAALNRLIGPLFQSSAGVTSVAVAQESGREVLVFSAPGETGWHDRLTNPDAWGKEARFTIWDARGQLVSSEQRQVEYDARQRPWFRAVMAQQNEGAIYWTPPYKFLSTQELGISAVVRWQAGDGRRYAMTTDIKLLDLTRFTQQIDVAKSGLAAVLTEDGTVLAVPRDARFASSEAIHAALFKHIDALGVAPLAAAFTAWQDSGRPAFGVLTFDMEGAKWLTTFWPIHLGEQTLWVATLAPAADFGTVTDNTLGLGLALVLGGVLIASLGALWFGRRISAPIEELTTASARIGGMDLHHPIAVTSTLREIDLLAQSLEQMRLNLARAQSVLEATAEQERQAERALKESRELLLESQRLGKVGYLMTDLASGRNEVSESLIEMLDLPRRPFFGPGQVRQLVHPDDAAPLDAARAATVTGAPGAEGTFEFRARHSSGVYRWFEGTRRLRRDDSGKPVATLWVMIDVTERKEREEALRRSEERHRLILEHSGDGIAILRPDGTMLYRSPSLGSIALGYDDAEVVGRSLLERVHPEDVAATRAALQRVVATPGAREHGRARMRHANGSWRHLAWVARNAMDVPGIDGILVNWHDLTELTRLQDQLQQAQKLEALGQLAGGIAHDFNNVLGAMLGFADFLVQDLAADSPQHRYARSIVKAGHDARDLVAQILAFARRGGVERKPYDLGQILREAKDLVRGALPASTELLTELDAEGLVAEVNLAQMSQVMLNLCLNASDALAGAPGRVSISLARLSPSEVAIELARGEQGDLASTAGRLVAGSLDPTEAYARISVVDTGAGMEAAVLARIFDPFFTTKEHGRGTGLGLVVVQSIVTAYGGACIVTSRPGSGTRFSIYLPLRDAATAAAVAEGAPPIRGRGERVMVVDDDLSMAEMLTSGLERLGYKVVSLADPRRALELFAERPKDWDVVISDQIMPHMTGTSLFERLKAIQPSVCFILCTGFDAGASPERARALGIAAWFHKPVLPQEISAAIAGLVGKKKRAGRGKPAAAKEHAADTEAGGTP